MNTRMRSCALALLAVLSLASVVWAQSGGDYDLSWWTIDGGGGTVSGGGFNLQGTAGQPEAGPTLSGGDLSLNGGFWVGGGGSPPVCNPLSGVAISGPTASMPGVSYSFSAGVTPANASAPITYNWSPAPGSGQGSGMAGYTWATPGTYTITVSASNCSGSGTANDSHTIIVSNPPTGYQVFLPLVLNND